MGLFTKPLVSLVGAESCKRANGSAYGHRDNFRLIFSLAFSARHAPTKNRKHAGKQRRRARFTYVRRPNANTFRPTVSATSNNVNVGLVKAVNRLYRVEQTATKKT